MGRLSSYKPWMRIRRNHSSKISKQVFCNLTLRPTNHHLLSGLEYKTALLNVWLGAKELRECLPLWPDPHPHPQSGLDREIDQQLDESPGLLDIAKDAGIDHGVYVGTRIPYVASCDLVLWIPWNGPTQKQLRFISCKPIDEIRERPRVRERLELERRYARANGGSHIIETGVNLPSKLIDNLDWILPLRHEVLKLTSLRQHNDFCESLTEVCRTVPLGQAIATVGSTFKLSTANAFMYFRVGAWLQKIDINLNLPVVMSKMMHPDHGVTLNQWRSHYWGKVEEEK